MSAAPVIDSPAGTAADRRARWTRPTLIANLVAQIGIVVTGGAVRLTGSGLGCSTWPQCEPGAFTPSIHEATTLHPYIEFGNRTLTGVLGIIALAVAVLVWSDRSRSRSYRLLGLAPLVGVLTQAVIGGITVLLDLDPAVVALHMLVSLGLVAASTVLLVRHRAGDGAPRPVVTPWLLGAGWALAALAVVVVALGVVVTGAGPHGGDDEVAYRFAVDPALAARVHALSVWAFGAVLVAMVVGVFRAPSPATTRRAVLVLLGVTLAQGLIGYVQYFTGLPEVLVGLHMLGAGLLTAATTWAVMALRTRA